MLLSAAYPIDVAPYTQLHTCVANIGHSQWKYCTTVSPSVCPSIRYQLAKMLITLKPHGIF